MLVAQERHQQPVDEFILPHHDPVGLGANSAQKGAFLRHTVSNLFYVYGHKVRFLNEICETSSAWRRLACLGIEAGF